MKLLKTTIILLCILTIIGCSSKDVDTGSSHQKEEEKAEIPEKVEDMIAQGPGKYAGDNYNEEKVKAELDKIDPEASKEEIYSTVMDLLAEDFSSVQKSFEQVDTSFTIDSVSPGTDVEKPSLDQYNVSILLDASGSMEAQVNGGQKMDVAKEAVETFVSNFPKEANVSLIVYGHKGSNSEEDKQLSCSKIEEIYPLSTYDESTFSKAIKQVDATGWTPLADAIKKSGETLKDNSDKNSKNVVYIVSDGLETCGGNPAKEAEALQKDGISATVNIVGFDVNNTEQRALKEVAEAGGGTFTSASSKSDLKSYFEGQYNKLELEWMQYEILVGGNITDEREDRINDLVAIRDEFLEKKEREQENVEKVMDYLKTKGIEESIKTDYKNRKRKIHRYLWDMYKKLDKELQKNSMDLKKKLKDNVQKKRDELEKKKEDSLDNN
ncbi:vWA domain-containing protein [Paludifilum halophilum]|uniref:VWFA domain-containing protein n=1 Tax=Paludifilum halophilum TaxID=1642702 RepID=A0A235B254_9BACL|nr:VWA domain-containing protein [Paludifilum halophilum]OYD06322.1 hypothetical protein CHM34_16525 [Paludifilum halophilum]